MISQKSQDIGCVLLLYLFLSLASLAQISTDGSLDTPAQELTGPDFIIHQGLGKPAGKNLFHSFDEFNIKADESATFTGDANIERVISRVTGGKVSDIDGLLKSDIADADFYFINPAGVLFGPNASIDIDGSFHVSTSDYLKFGENDKFFAQPLENEVLSTEAPTAYGFLDAEIGKITFDNVKNLDNKFKEDEATAVIGDELSNKFREGEAITVIGGDIKANGSTINAPGKDIALISVASPGELNVGRDDINSFTFDAEEFTDFGNITLSETTKIITDGERAGQITLQGKNIELSSGTLVQSATRDKNGGDITVMSSERLSVLDGSEIFTYTTDKGKGGNIDIYTSKLNVESSLVDTLTAGKGMGGNISMHSESIHIDGIQKVGSTFIAAQTIAGGSGGNITIHTDTLDVINGAFIDATTSDSGKGGNITVKAESIVIDGNGSATGLTAQTHHKTYKSSAGIINIKTDSLEILNNGRISGTTIGAGDGGTIEIDADSVRLKGSGSLKEFTGITVQTRGRTVDVTMTKSNFVRLHSEAATTTNVPPLRTDLQVIARNSTSGSKNGNGAVHSENLILELGSEIATKTLESSRCGEIAVYPNSIRVDHNKSVINPGNGGDININASTIRIENGGLISAPTRGEGEGGQIEVTVDDLIIDGHGQDDPFTGIGAQTHLDVNGGKGGDISINATNKIHLNNNGRISASSLGSGNGGKITLNAPELFLSGNSDLESLSVENGNAERIHVSVNNLEIENSTITAEARMASGADLVIHSSNTIFAKNANISSKANLNGGNIQISSGIVHVVDSELAANAGENGGNISMNTNAMILDNSRLRADAKFARAGNVFINTKALFASANGGFVPPEELIDVSSELGISGTITITAPDIDITAGLASLSEDFIEADRWTLSSCSDKYNKGRIGSFTLSPNVGENILVDDLLPSVSFTGKRKVSGDEVMMNEREMDEDYWASFGMPCPCVEMGE